MRKAIDGTEGLMAVTVAAPSLVVTDICMPGSSGAVVIAEIKRIHPAMPIIAISGLFDAGKGLAADMALAIGAARALAKPFKRNDLLRTVAELLREVSR